MNEKEKKDFKEYFHRYIFGQSNGYEVLQAFESIPNLSNLSNKFRVKTEIKGPDIKEKTHKFDS